MNGTKLVPGLIISTLNFITIKKDQKFTIEYLLKKYLNQISILVYKKSTIAILKVIFFT